MREFLSAERRECLSTEPWLQRPCCTCSWSLPGDLNACCYCRQLGASCTLPKCGLTCRSGHRVASAFHPRSSEGDSRPFHPCHLVHLCQMDGFCLFHESLCSGSGPRLSRFREGWSAELQLTTLHLG